MVTINDKHMNKSDVSASESTDKRNRDDSFSAEIKQEEVQGEGDYRAAREFNELEHAFVKSGGVPAAARAAAPKSEAERQEMLRAEQEGKQRSKGEDRN